MRPFWHCRQHASAARLTPLRCSAVALAGLAGAALRVFQLRVESDALPDGHAVVCSFSVPVDIMAQAEQCVSRARQEVACD